MPYIGNSPGTGTRNRFIYTATASQTTFSGADDNGKTLKYADSDYVDVYLNGICLVPVTDYTSTSKTSIVLTQAASLNDTLEVVAYDIATISDTVSKADGGNFEAGINIDGDVGIGTTSPDSLLHLSNTDATAYSATATDGQVGDGPTIYLENPANANNTVGGQIVFGMRSTEEQARIAATGGTAPAITFGTADAERARITANGLTFNGDTAAANALDDYEEGTWTITTNGDSTGVLASGQEGTYTKIGNTVTVHGVFQVSTSFSDNAIGGLPFNPYNPVNIVSSIHGVGAMQYSSSYAFTRIAHNDDIVRFYTAGGSSINPSTSNDPFRFVITYLTTT